MLLLHHDCSQSERSVQQTHLRFFLPFHLEQADEVAIFFLTPIQRQAGYSPAETPPLVDQKGDPPSESLSESNYFFLASHTYPRDAMT